MRAKLVVGLVTAALAAIVTACQLTEGTCVRMSDCDTGYTCVEGTCLSNDPAAPSASMDEAGTTDATTGPVYDASSAYDANVADASVSDADAGDASHDADAGDASDGSSDAADASGDADANDAG